MLTCILAMIGIILAIIEQESDDLNYFKRDM